MSRDDLKQLLRNADATAPAPPLAPDLSGLVRRRLARRRQRHAIAAALGVFILVGLGVLIILRSNPPSPRHVTIQSPTTTTTTAATVAARLSATAAAADFAVTATLHELTVQKLLAADAVPVHRDAGARAAPSPSDAQLLRDRAALVLVYDADRDVRENRPAAARVRYRRAIELFPQTHWAQVARQRLKEIQT